MPLACSPLAPEALLMAVRAATSRCLKRQHVNVALLWTCDPSNIYIYYVHTCIHVYIYIPQYTIIYDYIV
jgi:hypothetical protein